MFQEHGSRIPGSVVAAGGVLWLAKLTVIVITGGEVLDEGAAAVFYLLGFLTLVAGAALLGYWLAAGHSAVVRIAASMLGVVGVFAVTFAIDVIGRSLVGERGPAYAADEAGILLTAILALAVGVWLWMRAAREDKPIVI